jgi:hypothetical protein
MSIVLFYFTWCILLASILQVQVYFRSFIIPDSQMEGSGLLYAPSDLPSEEEPPAPILGSWLGRLGVLAEIKSSTDRPAHGVVINDDANSHHGRCPENIDAIVVIILTGLIYFFRRSLPGII